MSSEVSNQPHRPQHQDSFSFDAATSDSSTSTSATSRPSTPCMQLKGSLVPMTVLELNRFDPEQFEQDLRAKVAQAPDFFENLPVVLSLEKMVGSEQPDFAVLQDICQQFSVRVVAIRGGSEAMQQAARQLGLGILAAQKERATPVEPPAPAAEAQRETIEVVRTVVEKVVETIVEKERQISKIVHHPIRSGQQVYAADGDLIIMASVSAGAEILADGNIHVYGALRGRALAGVKGNVNARIFCYSMEAELISIAGQYKINEDMDRKTLRKPTQVYLENDALKLVEIEF